MDQAKHILVSGSEAPISWWQRLVNYFSEVDFMPHGHCYLWKPGLVWTHVISDFLIGTAYVTIAITLYGLIKKINLGFNRVFLCFGVFIAACGWTHYNEIWNLWYSDYWYSGLIKVLTAAASVGTGIYLWKLREPIRLLAESARLSEQRKHELENLAANLEKRVIERTSEQIKLHEILNLAEKKLQTITDNASSSLFMMDKNGHPTFMNPAAEKLTGYKLEEIKDKPLHYAVHYKKPDGSHYPMEECPIDNAQAELKSLQDQEEVFTDKFGRLFPVSFSIAPLEKAGEVIGSVLEFRDISVQKKIELDLKAALKVRDEFVSVSSHELKTPLTTLLIHSQLLQSLVAKNDPRAYDKERIDSFVNQTEEMVLRLNRIVEDMLDISRIRSGQLNIEKQKFDLCKIILEILDRMDSQFNQAGYDRPTFEGQKSEGFWDPLRLEQVINNLLTNAIKYGEHKQIAITLENKGHFALLTISDQGLGIPEDKQKIIFERFERAVDSNEVSGLGLGLYICQQIISAHDGEIWVESQAGKGSKFMVKLPFATAKGML